MISKIKKASNMNQCIDIDLSICELINQYKEGKGTRARKMLDSRKKQENN